MHIRALWRVPNARYAFGAGLSWPLYGGLVLCIREFAIFAVAAALSWIISYGCVYVVQRFETLHCMSRAALSKEIASYCALVILPSAGVNFGFIAALSGSPLRQWLVFAIAASFAAVVGLIASKFVLRL